MSEYLTPSRIALLLVLEIYCSGYVPPEGQLAVLAFITSRIAPEVNQGIERQHKAKRSPINHFSLSLDDLRILLLSYKTRIRDPDDPIWAEKTVWGIFEAFLCSIKNTDTLLRFIKRLSQHLTPAGAGDGSSDNSEFSSSNEDMQSSFNIDQGQASSQSHDTIALPLKGPFPTTNLGRGSLFGIYIAQVQVEAEKLKFEDLMKVWHEYDLFRRPLMPSPEFSDTWNADVVAEMNAKSGGRIGDIIHNSLREKDITTTQSSSVDTEKMLEFQVQQMQKFGARVPESTRLQLRNMIGSAGIKSNVLNYASFLDAWYQGDYTSSFENLRRYYDYAMEHTDRSHYQYALLNLAVLQADFGSDMEAVAAMKETIATARENKDMGCLSYCLSWLCQFEAMHTGRSDVGVLSEVLHGSEDAGIPLMYLKAAAREQGMPSIESDALLREAAMCLSNGHRPLEAFERIYESSYLIIHHQLDNMRAPQTLTQASLYARLGATPLATSLCNLVVDSFSQITLLEEMMRARGQQSYMLALAGKYDAALDILSKCQNDALRDLKCQQYLAQCIGIIKLKRALHRHDLLAAERLIAMLKSSPLRHPDAAFVVSLAEIDYQIRLENFSDAFDLIHAQFDNSKVDVYQRIRLLNAKVFLFAAVGRPQKGFSLSLRAATAAYRSKNALALWESVSAVVTVLNSLGEWDTAISLVETSVYHATETENAAVIAQLRSVGADSFMGKAKELENDDYERQKTMMEALRWVDIACEEYEKLEDYRAQYDMTLKARLILKYHKDELRANAKSEKLQKLERLIYP